MDQSTEYLLHTLGVALDNLRERMRLEAARDQTDMHYHYVRSYVGTCTFAGCSGLDPVAFTIEKLNSELIDIRKEFPALVVAEPKEFIVGG
jgi:hypothetical protein